MYSELQYTAFVDQRRIASGSLLEVGLKVKALLDGGEQGLVTIFEDETGRVIDLDYSGSEEEFRTRTAALQEADPAQPGPVPKRRGPGRPKLGVVAREVTLLPRHWEWLNAQPGGASVTLRKLVEKARREGRHEEQARRLRDGVYRFMSYMAGNLIGFEEATRALYAKEYRKLEQLVQEWPADIREHLLRLMQSLRQAEAEAAAKTE